MHRTAPPRTSLFRLLLSTLFALGGLLTLVVAPVGANPVTKTVVNLSGITIPASGTAGVASPYPSTINIAGTCGLITKVTVKLSGLTHTWPDDIDVLLVAPGGQKILLMSDAGGGNAVSSVNLTFDDSAAGPLPDTAQIVSGTYTRTNWSGNDGTDIMPAPAPSGPYTVATLAAAFNGVGANGAWQLFIQDDLGGSTGSLAGWELSITTDCAVLSSGNPGSFTASPGGSVTGVAGELGYSYNTLVTLTPVVPAGQTFVAWGVDGAYKGWANPLTITMNANHQVTPLFLPTKTFNDVTSDRPDYTAVVELASRGFIAGYNSTTYAPDNTVTRAEMAALIARATPQGPGTPPSYAASPPCVALSWDCEVWPNDFQDKGTLPDALWRDVAALRHYQVAYGYTAGDCTAKGLPSPCFAPNAQVSYAETIVFITRAMVAKGYWQPQPAAPQPYAGVPAVFNTELATYTFYTGGVDAPPADWNAAATRGWFARTLWKALNTYWGVDGTLPDGNPAGGYVP